MAPFKVTITLKFFYFKRHVFIGILNERSSGLFCSGRETFHIAIKLPKAGHHSLGVCTVFVLEVSRNFGEHEEILLTLASEFPEKPQNFGLHYPSGRTGHYLKGGVLNSVRVCY